MARTHHRLNSLAIARAHLPGYVPDGGGLYLQISTAGTKSWIFRYTLNKRRREMGLGAFPAVGLSDARQGATSARTLVAAGRDPIDAREAERARQRLLAATGITFDKATELYIADHESTWRNEKHRQQWRNTLATYASPSIGSLAVGSIGTPAVTRILDPIWQKKPETASRVRGRIERILDWSKVRGYRDGENPARWRGHLDKVFPPRRKLVRVKHHAAIPIDDMPAVYARLRDARGIAARAARFTILTAARAGETTGATWPEIDLAGAVWTVPADRMKARRDHRVPLSREALAILEELKDFTSPGRVFPGQRAGRPLSIAAISKTIKEAAVAHAKTIEEAGGPVVTGGLATTHGCRSTFKDWASERTNFPGEVSEMALAHTIGDETEAAYRRGELLKKRAALMQAWASFIATPRKADNVVELARSAA